MAGTTVRDDGVVARCFEAAFVGGGYEPGSEEYTRAARYALATMGHSKIEVFTHIFGADRQRAERANATFEQTYDAAVAGGEIRSIDGAEEVFELLRARDVKVALTTGFSPSTRDRLIDALGWRDHVDCAFSPADVGGRGRPHPDMLLAAMLRAEVEDVRDVAVFGDTPSDLVSGSRCGASIVAGVRTGGQRDEAFAAVPHTHILDSVLDAPALLFP